MHSTIEHAVELAAQPNTILINPPKPSKTWGRHNPVVMATSTMPGKSMNNCQDVREIYNECLVSHSNATICKTAASYLGICR
jgi:enterochelin esterase-like enzyme